jgi:hypothetical protein
LKFFRVGAFFGWAMDANCPDDEAPSRSLGGDGSNKKRTAQEAGAEAPRAEAKRRNLGMLRGMASSSGTNHTSKKPAVLVSGLAAGRGPASVVNPGTSTARELHEIAIGGVSVTFPFQPCEFGPFRPPRASLRLSLLTEPDSTSPCIQIRASVWSWPRYSIHDKLIEEE